MCVDSDERLGYDGHQSSPSIDDTASLRLLLRGPNALSGGEGGKVSMGWSTEGKEL